MNDRGDPSSPNHRYGSRPGVLTRPHDGAEYLRARMQLHRECSVNLEPWQEWVFGGIREVVAGIVRERPPGMRKDPIHIFEVGCGNAEMWRVVAADIPMHWNIVLTDLSESMVDAAQENLRSVPNPEQFSFAPANAEQLDVVPDASADVVIANHMLFHVADRDLALTGFKRVLRSGGALVASTNGSRHLEELHVAAAAFFPTIRDDPSAKGFGFETGLAQLADHFNDVRLLQYRDALVIDRPELAVNYILSTMHARRATARNREQFRTWVATMVREYGTWRVTKESGVFVARHPHAIDPADLHSLSRSRGHRA